MHALIAFQPQTGVAGSGVVAKKYYTFPSRRFGWVWILLLVIIKTFYVK